MISFTTTRSPRGRSFVDVPGACGLDLPPVLSPLGEHAPADASLVIEYELPAERATEALGGATESVRTASGGDYRRSNR